MNSPIELLRDCPAVYIPEGTSVTLTAVNDGRGNTVVQIVVKSQKL